MRRFSGKYTTARHDEAVENVPEEFRGDVVNALNFLEDCIAILSGAKEEAGKRISELESEIAELRAHASEQEGAA